MNGVEMIAAERARQVEAEGYTPEHDDEHVFGEMAAAGASYADVAARQIGTGITNPSAFHMLNSWRWPGEAWKPSDDPIRNLVKAGALIAAEIDRLERERQS